MRYKLEVMGNEIWENGRPFATCETRRDAEMVAALWNAPGGPAGSKEVTLMVVRGYRYSSNSFWRAVRWAFKRQFWLRG